MAVKAPTQDQVDKLQRQVDSLLAAQGIPSDPIAAGLKNVYDHLTVRAAMLPQHDFTDLLSRHEALGDSPTVDQVAAYEHAVRRFSVRSPELAYVHQLTEDLHQTLLDKQAEDRAETVVESE